MENLCKICNHSLIMVAEEKSIYCDKRKMSVGIGATKCEMQEVSITMSNTSHKEMITIFDDAIKEEIKQFSENQGEPVFKDFSDKTLEKYKQEELYRKLGVSFREKGISENFIIKNKNRGLIIKSKKWFLNKNKTSPFETTFDIEELKKYGFSEITIDWICGYEDKYLIKDVTSDKFKITHLFKKIRIK